LDFNSHLGYTKPMSDNLEKASEGVQKTLTFGAWLKDQRVSKKVSLEEIAAVTKIHIGQLRNLEEGWEGTPPAPAFVRGFIVSYAKHIGLDEIEVLSQFQKLAPDAIREKVIAPKQNPPQTYTANSGKPLRFGSYNERKDQLQIAHWLSTKRVIYALGVILGLALLIFLMRIGKKAGDENASINVSPTQVASGQASSQVKIVDQVISETSVSTNIFGNSTPYSFTLISSADCWVNLKADDNSLESFKLEKGQSRKILFNRKSKITLSHPSFVKIQINEANFKIQTSGTSAETLTFPEQATKLVALPK
jgi:cytoskeletal protein RodZ